MASVHKSFKEAMLSGSPMPEDVRRFYQDERARMTGWHLPVGDSGPMCDSPGIQTRPDPPQPCPDPPQPCPVHGSAYRGSPMGDYLKRLERELREERAKRKDAEALLQQHFVTSHERRSVKPPQFWAWVTRNGLAVDAALYVGLGYALFLVIARWMK